MLPVCVDNIATRWSQVCLCLSWDLCFDTWVTLSCYGKFAGAVVSTVDPKQALGDGIEGPRFESWWLAPSVIGSQRIKARLAGNRSICGVIEILYKSICVRIATIYIYISVYWIQLPYRPSPSTKHPYLSHFEGPKAHFPMIFTFPIVLLHFPLSTCVIYWLWCWMLCYLLAVVLDIELFTVCFGFDSMCSCRRFKLTSQYSPSCFNVLSVRCWQLYMLHKWKVLIIKLIITMTDLMLTILLDLPHWRMSLKLLTKQNVHKPLEWVIPGD